MRKQAGRPARRRGVVALVAAVALAGALGAARAGAAETPWTAHTITAGPRGADGVDLADADGDGDADVTTGWEEAGLVTVSLHPAPAAGPTGPWPTVTVGTRLHGVEDAIFADVDGDGRQDVISACECRKVTIHFAPDWTPADRSRLLDPAAWSSVTIAASVDLQRWMKTDVADVDGDGRLDVVAGGKSEGAQRPATVGWFRAPADPRDGTAWTYLPSSPVAWTMSLLARDVDADGDADVVLSDKTPLREPDGSVRYDLRGSRWLENTGEGAGWVGHRIGFDPGMHQFLHVVDVDGDGVEDVVDTASGNGPNRISIRRGLGGWTAWAATPVPPPDRTGRTQDVKAADLDLDGDLDLTLSHNHADGDLSGVVWLAAGADGTWTRQEISGPPGTKFDNVELADVDGDGDLDALTSEQVEQLGVVWYENPVRSPAPAPAPAG